MICSTTEKNKLFILLKSLVYPNSHIFLRPKRVWLFGYLWLFGVWLFGNSTVIPYTLFKTPWDPDYVAPEPEPEKVTGPVYKTPFIKDNKDDYESMQEKIDDILGEPLVETEENKKMIRTPHGELPNYSVGERFGIGNGVRKKVKVLFGKKYFCRGSYLNVSALSRH